MRVFFRYSWLQTEIRRRCGGKGIHVLVLANTNGSLSQGYLLPTPAPAPNSYQHRVRPCSETSFNLVTRVSQPHSVMQVAVVAEGEFALHKRSFSPTQHSQMQTSR